MQQQAPLEQLYNQCRASGRCHVLLDPQAGSPFAEQIASLDERLAPRVHLRDPLFANDPTEAPLLLSLPLSELSLIDAMAVHAQQEATDPNNPSRSICGFLQSAVPNARLASQLAWALNLKVENRGVYFRYFDPRVFLHLPRLLTRDAFSHLLQGVSSWAHFVWDGSLAVQEIPKTTAPAPYRLRMIEAQWQAFDTIEHFNATLRLFMRHNLPLDPARTADMFAQAHEARRLGPLTADDTAHYLACSLQSSEPLSQHPAWPDVLAMIKQDVPMAEALAQLCGISIAMA